MRSRLFCFLQIASGFVVLTTTLFGQRGGAGATAETGHVTAAQRMSETSGSARFSPPHRFPAPAAPALRPVQPGKYPDHDRHADDRRRGEGRYPYVSSGYAGLVPYGYGYPFAYGLIGDDQAGDAQDQPGAGVADAGQASPAADPGEPPTAAPVAPEAQAGEQVAASAAHSFRPLYRPMYQGPNQPLSQPPHQPPYQGQAVSATVKAQPATTLIFRDGRSPERVHNYALTGNTLYALDGDSRQEIPLSLLDIAATVEANRAAGVDFAVPVSR